MGEGQQERARSNAANCQPRAARDGSGIVTSSFARLPFPKIQSPPRLRFDVGDVQPRELSNPQSQVKREANDRGVS